MKKDAKPIDKASSKYQKTINTLKRKCGIYLESTTRNKKQI